MKSLEKIIALIKGNRNITIEEMAERLNITLAQLKKITKLKENGKIERIAPDKGGYWKVIEKKLTIN